MQILFRISQSNDKKGNPKNPDLDFLIEIHPEDGFLGGKIRFRRSIAKSEMRISKSKSGFSSQTQPEIRYQGYRTSVKRVLANCIALFSLLRLVNYSKNMMDEPAFQIKLSLCKTQLSGVMKST